MERRRQVRPNQAALEGHELSALLLIPHQKTWQDQSRTKMTILLLQPPLEARQRMTKAEFCGRGRPG